MPGPAAKHPDQRERRNATPGGQRLTSDGTLVGPFIPKDATYVLGVDEPSGVAIERAYHDLTREWWDTLRRDPLSRAFTDADWRSMFLKVLPLLDRWIGLGDITALKELRMQEGRYGLTPAARNSLGWVVDESVVGKPSKDGGRPARTRGRATDFRVHDGEGEAEAS